MGIVTMVCYCVLSEKELPDVHFNLQGYLFLATENGAENLKRNHETQM